MFLSNYHSHCTFCDGRGTMQDFVKFAISKGLKKYGFSSHAPLPFITKWTMPEDDFDEYQNEFFRLKQIYADKIELYLGLEVDYIHECSSIENTFFKDKKFDYLIGSVHYLDKTGENDNWSIDGNFTDFDAGLHQLFGGDIRNASRRYFKIVGDMIEKSGFDIVGHLDKITLHGMKYPDFNPADKWFVDLEADIFELIKRKNLILEINTKSLMERGITFPHQMFYPLINEMDIPVVVNSDCHYPTNLIDGFLPTYKALKKAGFKTLYQLVDGKWQAVEF